MNGGSRQVRQTSDLKREQGVRIVPDEGEIQSAAAMKDGRGSRCSGGTTPQSAAPGEGIDLWDLILVCWVEMEWTPYAMQLHGEGKIVNCYGVSKKAKTLKWILACFEQVSACQV